jgi:hypothetical protein
MRVGRLLAGVDAATAFSVSPKAWRGLITIESVINFTGDFHQASESDDRRPVPVPLLPAFATRLCVSSLPAVLLLHFPWLKHPSKRHEIKERNVLILLDDSY